jgi:hypothetical protein
MVWSLEPTAPFQAIVSGKRSHWVVDAIKVKVAILVTCGGLIAEEVAIVGKSDKSFVPLLGAGQSNLCNFGSGDRHVYAGPADYFEFFQSVRRVCGHRRCGEASRSLKVRRAAQPPKRGPISSTSQSCSQMRWSEPGDFTITS